MTATNESELVQRAMAGYFRAGGGQETVSGGVVMEHASHQYVVLTGATGTVCVFRVRNNGPLRRLKRWPPELSLSSPVNEGADLLVEAVKIADRLLATASGTQKADLAKLRKLVATAGYTLDATDGSAGEDLLSVWGLA